MSILLFVGTIAFLIFIHELGHFAAAKLVGIPVQEFGIGFPPRMLTLFKYGGTEFTLNWLPLGGFVRPEERDDEQAPDALMAAKPIKRIIVLLAGPIMNFLMAIIILASIFYSAGKDLTHVTITGIESNSPADTAGIQPEDAILSINGIEIESIDQLQAITSENKGKEVSLDILRDGETISLVLVPRVDVDEKQGAMGIGLYEHLTIPGAVLFAVQDLGFQIQQMATTSMRLVGLKGIYDGFQLTRDIDESEDTFFAGYFSYMFVASISFSLAALNLLPIPIFDGGKILLALPELLFKIKVPMNLYYALNVASLGLVLLFMVYVNVQDFINPAITLTPTP
jgi:regulator of sigma E protease